MTVFRNLAYGMQHTECAMLGFSTVVTTIQAPTAWRSLGDSVLADSTPDAAPALPADAQLLWLNG